MSDLTCASGVELLMDYLEGVLPDEVRVALDAHVADCPRCVAFIASYRDTPRLLREATDSPMPAELERSLRNALRRQIGLVE